MPTSADALTDAAWTPGPGLQRDLDRLTRREHDLLVVGGGIYGAALAWDAAQRGLSVALVEADDFGSGASWNSLKIIHGGLRYLQKADLRRMRASIRERRTLLEIAPELVRPLPFLIPTYGHGPAGREALAVALRLNDLAGFDRNRALPRAQQLPAGRLLSPREALARVPGLPENGLTGGALYFDAQVSSSERLLLAFLHAAAAAGAVAINHCEAIGLLRAGERVAGARVRDRVGGGELEVRARLVMNAAGPRLDGLLALAGLRRPPVPLLRAYNLVLGRPVAGAQAVGARSVGRFLFLVPWNGQAIVGTAYEPAGANGPGPGPFLDEAARAFPWAELTRADVRLVHAGRVPGRGGAAGLATRPLLIDHAREDGLPGLISVLGVKYTTARGVAEAAVDLAFRRLGRRAPPCRTALTPLSRARPLAGPLEERTRQAVREEQALRLSDAVLRRLDLGTGGPPGAAELDSVARVMAAELGWDAGRLADERRALAAVYAGFDLT